MDIVYTPLNEGKPELYPSAKPKIRWEDLLILYGKRVNASNSATDDDQYLDIYVVPEGKIFFLITANLSVVNSTATRQYGRIFIRNPGETSNSTRTMMTIGAAPGGQTASSISPVIPIIARYGENIGIFNEDLNVVVSGQITGYEIETNLFQTLF